MRRCLLLSCMLASACGGAAPCPEPVVAAPAPAPRPDPAPDPAPDPDPEPARTEAPLGTSTLRLHRPWLDHPAYLLAGVPWAPGVDERPCRMTEYDATGRVALTRTYEYDEERLVRVRSQEAEGQHETIHFCLPSGWASADLERDADGAIECVDDPDDGVPPLCYRRDERGVLRWQDEDELFGGHVRRDADGRVRRMEILAFGGEDRTVVEVERDGAGRVIAVAERLDSEYASDTRRTYAYDDAGNLATLTTTTRSRLRPDGSADTERREVTRFAYDAQGRLASCDGPHGHVVYAYDAEGRMTDRVATWNGQDLGRSELAYVCDTP